VLIFFALNTFPIGIKRPTAKGSKGTLEEVYKWRTDIGTVKDK